MSYTQFIPHVALITLSLGLVTSIAANALRQCRIRELAQLLPRD